VCAAFRAAVGLECDVACSSAVVTVCHGSTLGIGAVQRSLEEPIGCNGQSALRKESGRDEQSGCSLVVPAEDSILPSTLLQHLCGEGNLEASDA